jgi:hypothetical protein
MALATMAVTLAVSAGAAAAQSRGGEPVRVAGTYGATFSSVANNCDGVGMNIATANVELSQSAGRRISVTLPAVPIMSGVVNRTGKFKASVKRGKTAIAGVDGRFSVAGRVAKDTIQLLFIAEYFKGQKPLCTQSWNATGPRK